LKVIIIWLRIYFIWIGSKVYFLKCIKYHNQDMLCLKTFQENFNQYILILSRVSKNSSNVRIYFKSLRLSLDTTRFLDQSVHLMHSWRLDRLLHPGWSFHLYRLIFYDRPSFMCTIGWYRPTSIYNVTWWYRLVWSALLDRILMISFNILIFQESFSALVFAWSSNKFRL